MRKRRTILLIAVSALLLMLVSSTVWNRHREQRQQAAPQRQGVKLHDVESEGIILPYGGNRPGQFMQVNNIERGHYLKTKLDNQNEVTHLHHNNKDTSHYYDHEAAVQFKVMPSGEQLDKLTKDISGWVVKQDGLTFLFRSTTMETPEMLAFFQKNDQVEFAEPHYILMQNDVGPVGRNMPNDQLYLEKYQWNLPAIGTEDGWGISRGDEDIIIAVIDTGVDLDHPDLKNRLVDGYNVMNDNDEPDDDNGHGTHVAGIIASETNNHQGTAGVTWYNKIMPVKAMGAKGYGTTFDIAKGIIWAVDNGADVINLSLGNYQESNILQRAVRYAYDHDVVMVSAAGNDNSRQPSYPAAYPEVLSVSAISFDGNLAEFSNYGDYINVTAPGVYIPSTYFQNQYAQLSGTSMAAPHVAGLAGLVKSANPKLGSKEIMSIIQDTAIDVGKSGKDIQFGNGLIDVNKALTKAVETDKSKKKTVRERLWFLR
ncbi:S8 family peptidase [Bacillus sp. FJAT-27251]|uniref:S8 family peptidase n=1 Tax=Bacillus sp. FJAT-27251 TaxID=1684142 RepID=UPI000B02C9AE|nr:S8 family peptidase [Bacillus sp. FJAT-27251]